MSVFGARVLKLLFLKLDRRYGGRRLGLHHLGGESGKRGLTYGIEYDDGTVVRISPQVALAIYTVMAYRYPNMETFADIQWPNVDDTPDTFWNSISVQVTRANKVLRRGGLEIRPLGRRWTLARTDEQRAWLQPSFRRPIKTGHCLSLKYDEG